MVSQLVVQQAKSFIADLDLPAIDHRMPTLYAAKAEAFEDNTEGAAVSAGSLVSFVSGLTAQHKSDVLNSTLLAQLAANKQYDRYKQTREWYNFYCSVLAQVGWNVPTFAYREYTPSGNKVTLDAAVLEILSAVATGNEMEILKTTLSSLRDKPGNGDALVLFDQQSFPEKLGTFQIFPVAEDDGEVVMALAAMEFQAEQHVTHFLWWTWSSSTVKIFQSAQKAVLDEDLYKQVRTEVIKKLGDRAKQFIKDLEI